jgi:hypothetical protein
MKSMLTAAALLLVPAMANAQTAPAPAPAAAAEATMVVYDKALGAGWQNWSWGKTELSVDAGARKPMKLEAKAWEAIYLHHDAFPTAPYRSLNLLIQSVGAEADVRVVAIVGGKPILENPASTDPNSPPKGKTVHVKPGGWTEVVVPLGQLGADKITIDGLWIQNASASDSPPIYVADIAFKP